MRKLMRLGYAAVAAGMLAAGMLAAAGVNLPAAQAHPENDFYPIEWPVNSNEKWVFGGDVPDGDFRDQVKFGLGRWDNGVGGTAPNFIFDGSIGDRFTSQSTPCAGARCKIFTEENLAATKGWGNENVLGWTPSCYFNAPQGSSITKFMMVFERTAELGGANAWYTGTGDAPNQRWDLRSIATHESGHATGWYGHFSNLARCPSTPAPAVTETMCHGDVDLMGTTMLRTREEHDIHTFQGAY